MTKEIKNLFIRKWFLIYHNLSIICLFYMKTSQETICCNDNIDNCNRFLAITDTRWGLPCCCVVVVADHVDTDHCPILYNLHILPINHTPTVWLPTDRQEAEQGGHEDNHFGGAQVTVIFSPIYTSRLKNIKPFNMNNSSLLLPCPAKPHFTWPEYE